MKRFTNLFSKPKTITPPTIGQTPTENYVPLKDFTARPYPSTNVSIKYKDEPAISAKVVRDDDSTPGAQNIMVEYQDGKTQKFTSVDGDDISIQIGSVTAHYRGGIKRKYRLSRKNKKSKKNKSKKNKSKKNKSRKNRRKSSRRR